jgi:hypothetical protein
MSEPLDTSGQRPPFAGSASVLADLFAQSSAAEPLGREPTGRRDRRTTAARDKGRRQPGTPEARLTRVSRRLRGADAHGRGDLRARSELFTSPRHDWRGERPAGRSLLAAVTVGLIASALVVALIGMLGARTGHPVDRHHALSEGGREAREGAGARPAATLREPTDRPSWAASKPGTAHGRQQRQKPRATPRRPRARPVPSAKPGPSRSAPGTQASPEQQTPRARAAPRELLPPPTGDDVPPRHHGFPPPARRAPALPAPVPPGSPPEFL